MSPLKAQPDRTAVVRDPYARWCGRGGAARRPPIPINDPKETSFTITETPDPGQQYRQNRLHLLAVPFPAAPGARVKTLSHLVVTRGCDPSAAKCGFGVVTDAVVPAHAKKVEGRGQRFLERLDEVFVAQRVDLQRQDRPVLLPETHDLVVKTRRVLQVEKVRHRLIDLEVLHEAAQHAIARVPLGEQEAGLREVSVDEARVDGVQWHFVDHDSGPVIRI